MDDIHHTTRAMGDNHHGDPITQADTRLRAMAHQDTHTMDRLVHLDMGDSHPMILAVVHLDHHFLGHLAMVDFHPMVMGDLDLRHHLVLHHHHHLHTIATQCLLLVVRSLT